MWDDGEITVHDLTVMLPFCALMGPIVWLILLVAAMQIYGSRVLWRRRK